MTTTGIDPAGIFADARLMHGQALDRLVAGDIRDAAEKAWCATMRATEALVMARTGQEPGTSGVAGSRLRAMSQTSADLWNLRIRYADRQATLHGDCFYHDDYDLATTERLIHETADYIDDAQRLAILP